jgi:hypothetical protein
MEPAAPDINHVTYLDRFKQVSPAVTRLLSLNGAFPKRDIEISWSLQSVDKRIADFNHRGWSTLSRLVA